MLRQLRRNDLPQILIIEASVQPLPWNKEAFQSCLNTNCHGWVVEKEKRLIAFVITSIYMEECHILNLCVAREHQHQGIGIALLRKVLEYAKENGASLAYLEVRESNKTAIALYRKMDFYLVGKRKDYYPAGAAKENALLFVKSLHDGSS